MGSLAGLVSLDAADRLGDGPREEDQAVTLAPGAPIAV